jgi:hypothetical protein
MDKNSTIPSSEDTGHAAPCDMPCSQKDQQPDTGDTKSFPEGISGMTLEQVIDITGEFSHLHELVMIHIEKSGGFAGPEAYFKTVQPILDMLEIEIRVRCQRCRTQQEMKLIVQDWIDREIRESGD